MVKEADSRPAAQAHGFESHSSYRVSNSLKVAPPIALAQSVERRPFKPNVAGSSPARGKELATL